jgi:hypothetical protein
MLIEDNRVRQFDELILIIPAGLSGTLRDALEHAIRPNIHLQYIVFKVYYAFWRSLGHNA